MVDVYGIWTEEPDYTNFPKGEMCDYNEMAAWIRECGYEPKTTMENLISMMFAHYECEIEDSESGYSPDNFPNGEGKDGWIEGCKAYVKNVGISNFDYEA